MPEINMTQLSPEIASLIAAGMYAAENAAAFHAWAKDKGYLHAHAGCDHTKAQHVEGTKYTVTEGALVVAQAFSIGQAILDGLGG